MQLKIENHLFCSHTFIHTGPICDGLAIFGKLKKEILTFWDFKQKLLELHVLGLEMQASGLKNSGLVGGGGGGVQFWKVSNIKVD